MFYYPFNQPIWSFCVPFLLRSRLAGSSRLCGHGGDGEGCPENGAPEPQLRRTSEPWVLKCFEPVEETIKSINSIQFMYPEGPEA